MLKLHAAGRAAPLPGATVGSGADVFIAELLVVVDSGHFGLSQPRHWMSIVVDNVIQIVIWPSMARRLTAKSDAVFALVKQLRADGVPINRIGAQGHLDTKYGFPSPMQQNLQRFGNLGLKVALTEVDIRTTLPVTTPEQLAQNADYSQTLGACLLVRQCISCAVWGFGDAYSWVPGVFAGEGSASIYDESLQPKTQYYALQQVLSLAGGAPHRG